MKSALLGELLVKSNGERLGAGRVLPLLSMTMRDGLVDQSSKFKKVVASRDLTAYKVVRRGQLVVGFPIDEAVLAIQRIHPAGIVSPAYDVWDVRTELVDPDYLERYLKSPRAISYYLAKLRGSTARRRSLPKPDFDGMPVPLPPLSEQRRIASILDRAEGLVQLRERSRNLMHELESRLFASFFRDELSGGANAATIPLGEIAQCSSGITKGRRTAEPTSPTPYMAVSNVQDRRLDLSVVKLIDATEVERDRFRVVSGDLLLTEGGDPDKLGRGTVWRDEIEGAIHQNHIFRVRLTDENFLPDYLNWLLASDYGKSYFLSRAKQTTGIATINQTQLKAFPVIATKPERQRAFVRVLEAARASAGVADRHATRLTDLMVGLQARAFRGEL